MTFTATERAKEVEASTAHPLATKLTVELERLRRHARLIRTTYLPTPARAALLRENELAQLATLARLRALLGEREVFGGVRGNPPPGALRPAWSARW